MSDWIMAEGVLCYLIPSPPPRGALCYQDFVNDLDGLVLQGGSDVSPLSYGESPLKPEWSGDAPRDHYEIQLVRSFEEQTKPIYGICRGMQLINVAFGGTLFQDISTQVPGSLQHRQWDIYDRNVHEIALNPQGYLTKVHGGIVMAKVNSVHHQAIKDLAKGFRVEAWCSADKIVEAIRWEGENWMAGVQWHPEFQGAADKMLLPPQTLLRDFLSACEKRKKKGKNPQ